MGKEFGKAPAAKDVWKQTIDGYDKIANTPTGVPQKGDIVIWGQGVGPYGHIAVFYQGDAMKFTSFDQNWPVGTVCHFQPHNYTGVLGWFRPKVAVVQPDKLTQIRTVINSNDPDSDKVNKTKQILG